MKQEPTESGQEKAIVNPKRAGYLISKTTNPCILSLVMLGLLAVTKANNEFEQARWLVTLGIFLILLPLAYTYFRMYKAGVVINLKSDPTAFLKQHPRDILTIAFLFGISGLAVLYFIKTEPILLYTYLALLTASLVITLCNLYYRVSYHLGAMAVLVMMASAAWGPYSLLLLHGLPIIGWAKYVNKEHTVSQMLAGVITAFVTSGLLLVVYWA